MQSNTGKCSPEKPSHLIVFQIVFNDQKVLKKLTNFTALAIFRAYTIQKSGLFLEISFLLNLNKFADN